VLARTLSARIVARNTLCSQGESWHSHRVASTPCVTVVDDPDI